MAAATTFTPAAMNRSRRGAVHSLSQIPATTPRADPAILPVEWKTRGHDHAPGLHEALLENGFEPEEVEPVMIGPTSKLTVDVDLPPGRIAGGAEARNGAEFPSSPSWQTGGRRFPSVFNPNGIVLGAFEHHPEFGAVGGHPQDLVVRRYAVDHSPSNSCVIESNFDNLANDRKPLSLQVEVVFH